MIKDWEECYWGNSRVLKENATIFTPFIKVLDLDTAMQLPIIFQKKKLNSQVKTGTFIFKQYGAPSNIPILKQKKLNLVWLGISSTSIPSKMVQ